MFQKYLSFVVLLLALICTIPAAFAQPSSGGSGIGTDASSFKPVFAHTGQMVYSEFAATYGEPVFHTPSSEPGPNFAPPYQAQLIVGVYYDGLVSELSDGGFIITLRVVRNTVFKDGIAQGGQESTYTVPTTSNTSNPACFGPRGEHDLGVNVFDVDSLTGHISILVRERCISTPFGPTDPPLPQPRT